ncbi:MAG: hypothetical protein EAX87_08750 [Candidatus Thorarchaeota archaeon]|nr:hypothetical protein [Candidatus Thorarchaeota archaeon]
MKILDIQLLWLKLGLLRPYLPKQMFSYFKRTVQRPSPTPKQLGELTKLGESIGLARNEVIAAIDAPLAEQGSSGSGRKPMMITLILVATAIAVWSLFIWYVVSPETFPIPTYRYGTLYGTIKPQDFSS